MSRKELEQCFEILGVIFAISAAFAAIEYLNSIEK